MTDTPYDDMSLESWANKYGIPLRTAQGWAKKGKIPAKKKKIPYTVTLTRLIRTYVVPINTLPPADQE